MVAGIDPDWHGEHRFWHRVPTRNNRSGASVDRLDCLESLLSSLTSCRIPPLGEASCCLIGLAAPRAMAVAGDAGSIGDLAPRGSSRHSGRPAARYGGDVPGRSSRGTRTSPVLAAVGAVSVSVFSGAERSISRSFTADDYCRYRRCWVRFLHIPVFSDGYMIEIPEGPFEIAEACAGLRFLIASSVFGCFFAVVMHRSFLRRILFIIMSVEAYASVSGSAISGGTASEYGVEQISNMSRFGRLP
jgi:hypothetical protein